MLIRRTRLLCSHPRERGVVMLEVLISIVILAIGLLGLAKLQASTRQLEMESYQRAQAMVLLDDMVSRMTANKPVVDCYVTTALGTSAPWVGQPDGTLPPACGIGTASQQSAALSDLQTWQDELTGKVEASNGTNAGAMIGARGCIVYDATNKLYIVTVAWQGMIETVARTDPGLLCAQGLYGNSDAQRRVVSATVRVADLKAP